MTDNIIPLNVYTRLDIPVEGVLEGAKENVTANLIILGWTEDDDMYFASSSSTMGDILVLLEQAKRVLLEG